MIKPWQLSLILLIGSLAITLVLWMLGLPFFFVFLFIPLIPLLQRKQTIRAARNADGKPQAASASAPGMGLPSPRRVARSESERTDNGRCIPKRSAEGMAGNGLFPVVPYGATVDNDTQMQQVHSNAILRHSLTKSSAEIDQRGPDSRIRIEWYIRITDCVAFTTGKTPDVYCTGLQAVVFLDNRKLFFLRVVPGNLSPADRTGIPAFKYNSLTGSNAALDNIFEERGNA